MRLDEAGWEWWNDRIIEQFLNRLSAFHAAHPALTVQVGVNSDGEGRYWVTVQVECEPGEGFAHYPEIEDLDAAAVEALEVFDRGLDEFLDTVPDICGAEALCARFPEELGQPVTLEPGWETKLAKEDDLIAEWLALRTSQQLDEALPQVSSRRAASRL